MNAQAHYVLSLGAIFTFCTVIASGQTMNVKIIQRQSSETGYTYQVPGHLRSTSNGNANCDANSYGYSTDVNCHGSGTTNTTISAPQTFSYSVTGATYSLLLPDGRTAVVNCASKSPSFMTGFATGVAATNGSSNSVAMRRSCRTPLVDEIQVEFKGKNAKLKWPVSIDGKKFESETYTILAVLDSAPNQGALSENQESNGKPTASSPAPILANTEAAPSVESIAILKEQAANGDAVAQYYLGNAYETGKGVPQDNTQDAIWFRKAAEQGLADAQAELGADYALGQGVPQDFAEAYFWLDLAVAGMPVTVKPEDMTKARDLSAKSRDFAASLLTPDERSRVQERARKWFEDHPAKPQ